MPFITQGKTNWKFLFIIIILVAVVGGISWWTLNHIFIEGPLIEPEKTEEEQRCINSGGTVSTSVCCKLSGDFPNSCLIGACGCSPDNSHQVKVCDCGIDKCFDGAKCVSQETDGDETVSTSKQQICSYQTGALSRIQNYEDQNGGAFRVQGTHCVIEKKTANGYSVVVNGVTFSYPGISISHYDANFSLDGKHFVFTASNVYNDVPASLEYLKVGSDRFVVSDGIAGPVYNDVLYPQYSQDGNHLSYCATQNGARLRITDGNAESITQEDYLSNCFGPKQSDTTEAINDFGTTTSPGGKYSIRTVDVCGPNTSLMAECPTLTTLTYIPTGAIFGSYSNMGFLHFSSDDKHFFAISGSGPGTFATDFNAFSKKLDIIMDGNVTTDYNEIISLALTPDGKSLAYNARQGTTLYYVVQQVE